MDRGPGGQRSFTIIGQPALDNASPTNWAASREVGGTTGAENFPPFPIVINELHHTPSVSLQGEDNSYEFLELYNAGTQAYDLGGFTITGVTFSFSSWVRPSR